MATPLFDRVVVVDWSANARPKTGADSIWIAVVEGADCVSSNPRTRRLALGEIAALARPGSRTLLGVDFSLGFPSGTAQSAGLVGLPWAAMWSHLGAQIVDEENNANNRFEVAAQLNRQMTSSKPGASMPGGPFWGCPPSRVSDALTSTKPARSSAWPSEWRQVEAQMRLDGHHPFSGWQLLGAGAVGSQSLVGIAALERLRWNLGDRLAVWPFDTELDVPWAHRPDAEVVVAEVWPSLWPVSVPDGMVKDAAQVESTARRLAALDAAGELRPLFRPTLDVTMRQRVVDEEGWVLGVTVTSGARHQM